MYVALKRQRFGDRILNAGDEVPYEEGRNYNLMVRQGLVADIDERNRSEESTAQLLEAHQARIGHLERELEEAHAEIAELRGEAAEPEKAGGASQQDSDRPTGAQVAKAKAKAAKDKARRARKKAGGASK